MRGVCERRVPELQAVDEGQLASCFLYSEAPR
jgi:hypothetical protein